MDKRLARFKRDHPEEYAKLYAAKLREIREVTRAAEVELEKNSQEGYAIAYRVWSIFLTEKGFRLGSVVNQMDGSWLPGVAQPSKCLSHTHRAPVGSCYCGYYVTKEPANDYIGVLGSVKIWGKFIEFSRGFRVEFAYPKSIIGFNCRRCSKVVRMSQARGFLNVRGGIDMIHTEHIPSYIPMEMSFSGSYILERLEDEYVLEVSNGSWEED
jgi:hypothetical protein